MTDSTTEQELPWTVRQTPESLVLIHDNRWLAIFGIPMSLVGMLIACGPWFIESARNSDDWMILAGGSVIGLGFIVFGLALCFHYAETTVDLSSETVRHSKGLKPFQRVRTWPIQSFDHIRCGTIQLGRFSNTTTHYTVSLKGPKSSFLFASSLDKEAILLEALRWSEFLKLPVDDQSTD